jgi:hypothetical protein
MTCELSIVGGDGVVKCYYIIIIHFLYNNYIILVIFLNNTYITIV